MKWARKCDKMSYKQILSSKPSPSKSDWWGMEKNPVSDLQLENTCFKAQKPVKKYSTIISGVRGTLAKHCNYPKSAQKVSSSGRDGVVKEGRCLFILTEYFETDGSSGFPHLETIQSKISTSVKFPSWLLHDLMESRFESWLHWLNSYCSTKIRNNFSGPQFL